MRRRILRGLTVVLALLAVLTLRVVRSSRSELAQGRALEVQEPDAAIVHYRRAVRWYAPLSPYPVEALERLERLGAAAERDGDSERALAAYRAMRAGILSTRSFYTPSPEALARANERIARLMAQEPPPPIDAGKTPEELYREHLALLEQSHRPRLFFGALALLGLAIWIGAAFAFVSRAIDAEDRVLRPQALRYGGLVLAGFVLFALGLAFA